MKISLIVLGALAVSLLMRHRSAALRHWVLAAGVACAAAVPALEASLPAWTLPFAAPAPFERYVDASQAASTTSRPRTASRSSDAGRGSSPAAAMPSRFDIGATMAATLSATWAIGAVIGLSILLVGILRLTWLAGRAHRVTTGRWSELADEISLAYGLRRPVVLLQTDHPSLLVTWGLAHPKVLLPAAAVGGPRRAPASC